MSKTSGFRYVLVMIKKPLFMFLYALLFALQCPAAVLHFYSNPNVPQPLFHVTLEYQGFIYEAAPRVGGHQFPVTALVQKGDIQIEIPDRLVNEAALASQMGLPFDYEFIWDNQKTYCSKLVGMGLNMPPQPMSFVGTHYLKYYPHWIHRHDPGLSPDQIHDFGLNHGRQLYPPVNVNSQL